MRNSVGSIPTPSTKSLLIFYAFVRSCSWPLRVFNLRPLVYLEHRYIISSYIFWEAKNVCHVKQQIFVIYLQEAAQRDYSLCTPLHGPPRSKDKIAYKVSNTCVVQLPDSAKPRKQTMKFLDSPLLLEYLFEIGDCETKWYTFPLHHAIFWRFYSHLWERSDFVKFCLLCAIKIIV